ncbi:MAG: tetratricopeptide repeat protein [Gammaproteobacteria bacterium]|nr:tetratricopeptide repeat protein [Gammaproteobacteria bacterium]
MTDIHVSEDEQVEALKRWLKENGTSMVVGTLIGIAIIAGVWYWQGHRHVLAENGSATFSEFSAAVQANNQEQISNKWQALHTEYNNTPYATLAAFIMAKRSVDKGDLTAAEDYAKLALDNAKHDALRHLARLRLARLLVQEKKLDPALALIADQKDPAFVSDYAELRGDIYAQQNKPTEARAAYTEALADTTLPGQRRSSIEMKRDDLITSENPAPTPVVTAAPTVAPPSEKK